MGAGLVMSLAIGGGSLALVEGGSTVAATPVAVSTTTATTATTSTAEAAGITIDTAALDAITTDARFAVAVLDETTGETQTYGDTGTFDTASIVKVDILATLLAQTGGELTTEQQALAAVMIEQSDNDAATALFEAAGGAAGLEAFNATIGLSDTDVSSTWGLTQTTPTDQVTLLAAVLGEGSVLADTARDLVRTLMTQVIAEQRFGVTAVADDPDATSLKVGYLQRSATGLWDVASIGEVVVDGHTHLVAVLSDGSADLASGTALVDQVVEAAFAGASTADTAI